MRYRTVLITLLAFLMLACNKETDKKVDDCIDSHFFSEYSSRSFKMGFSTWAYAKRVEAVDSTYLFIRQNSDIYSEHIDNNIPWNSWINDLPLPAEFTNEIAARVSRRIVDKKLTVSVSLLNTSRNELAPDFDGSVPEYSALNDVEIADAYFKHLRYIVTQLNPDYLIIAIEVNELLINAPDKWEDFKLLMANVKARIRQEYPALQISESITLHNLYHPDVANPEDYIDEVVNYVNTNDFVSISFYPYFKALSTKAGFQDAFDFLHDRIDKPIAIAETGHLSENLKVDSYAIHISGNQCEQNEYLEVLLSNAQNQKYEYVIWWTHRDYNELWAEFPIEVRDIGKLWLSTGLMNEDGIEKKAYSTWKNVFNK